MLDEFYEDDKLQAEFGSVESESMQMFAFQIDGEVFDCWGEEGDYVASFELRETMKEGDDCDGDVFEFESEQMMNEFIKEVTHADFHL